MNCGEIVFGIDIGGTTTSFGFVDKNGHLLANAVIPTCPNAPPEAIFLSGGLTNSGDLLLTPAKKYLEEFLFTQYKGKVKLMLSGIPAGNSSVMGAAALIWHEISCKQCRELKLEE